MVEATEYVMIPVFKKTKDRLDNNGTKGETYDELVNRILNIVEKVKSR